MCFSLPHYVMIKVVNGANPSAPCDIPGVKGVIEALVCAEEGESESMRPYWSNLIIGAQAGFVFALCLAAERREPSQCSLPSPKPVV